MTHLKVGDTAPEFVLKDADGAEISLRDFAGSGVILYFYPKDNTSGCTIEAVDFSALLEKFRAKNFVVLGVSKDAQKSHQNFIAKYNLKHILLCDTDNEVAKKYGIFGEKMMYGKKVQGVTRSTFVIDSCGKIANIFYNAKAKNHAQAVLDSLG